MAHSGVDSSVDSSIDSPLDSQVDSWFDPDVEFFPLLEHESRYLNMILA
jgi:hypothetical protein